MPVGVNAGDDRVLPFQLDALGVRGRLVRLGPAVDAILARHDYPDAVARLLAEALALGSALATSLKYDGVFTLQARGEGPVKLAVVDLTTAGALRGYAQYDAEGLKRALAGVEGGAPAPDVIPRLFGRGHLAFTVDQGADTERYQGVVALEGASLADCAHHYFRQSEQLPTAVKLATARDAEGRWRAAALMLQRLPSTMLDADIDADEREENWRTSAILGGSARDGELLGPEPAAEATLWRLFHQAGVRTFDPVDLRDECRCSAERVVRVLRSIPREELEGLRDESGDVAVTCEFCSTVRRFDEAAVAALYSTSEDVTRS